MALQPAEMRGSSLMVSRLAARSNISTDAALPTMPVAENDDYQTNEDVPLTVDVASSQAY